MWMLITTNNLMQWEKHCNKNCNKNTVKNIFRMVAYDSVIYAYFCTGFIDFNGWDKIMIDITNLFSPETFITMIE